MKILTIGMTLMLALSDRSQPSPEVLTFDELVRLSSPEALPAELESKLARVLDTPIVDNAASRSGVTPHRPVVAGLGPTLRAAEWNIERGLQFDMIRLALSNSQEFLRRAQQEQESGSIEGERLEVIESQLLADHSPITVDLPLFNPENEF